MNQALNKGRILGMAAVVTTMLVLAGCVSKNGQPPPMGGANAPATGPNAGVQGGGTGNQAVARGLRGVPPDDRAKFKNPGNPLSTRTILFEFDSSSIQPRYAKVIKAHAQYLANHKNVHLRLEGHTDKRGTREYNIALGSRRAQSVEKALSLAGASSDQLSTLSFGEERPAVLGDSSSASAKNRRVVLIYTQNR